MPLFKALNRDEPLTGAVDRASDSTMSRVRVLQLGTTAQSTMRRRLNGIPIYQLRRLESGKATHT